MRVCSGHGLNNTDSDTDLTTKYRRVLSPGAELRRMLAEEGITVDASDEVLTRVAEKFTQVNEVL